jgi:hypothetical protein
MCEGFLPENNLKIPISVIQLGGITEAEFNAVLDEVEKIYSPIVSSKGATLKVNRLWSDGTVNASAQQFGSTWSINMYGGLARHPEITRDGFQLVACHEMGHHLGGAPKMDSWFASWATNEGGADYFSGLRCLRKVFTPAETRAWASRAPIDAFLRTQCELAYNNQDDELMCMRIAMAGYSVTALFKELKEETREPKFETPDPAKVGTTDDTHPDTQCRLDTYFQSALCVHDTSVELSDTDYHVGTCTALNSKSGLRPRCWFKPDEADLLSLEPLASN